jgi:hypothetical protein
MFPYGWDEVLYPTAALNSVLPTSSSADYSRKMGGCREEGLNGCSALWKDQESYVERVLCGEEPISLLPSRVMCVEAGGKHRIVSKSDIDMNLLRPLHTAIYNRLSKFSWLLRGDAKASSFRKFKRVDGEVFVSGDYESATDNLNLYVQKVILNRILSGCKQVPESIKDFARASQTPFLLGEGVCSTLKRGQLMGNLLSFPLLCIVNYLGFRYYTGQKDLPVRINGDDIVFRADRATARRWMEGVSGAGLTLSVGKTMVHSRYFTLNSSLFKAVGTGAQQLSIVRSTAMGLKRDPSPIESLPGRWRKVVSDYRPSRSEKVILGTYFLRWNKRDVVGSRRSLTRGLDMSIPHESLAACNLWRRECFYLDLPREVPLPLSPEMREKLRVPIGWERRRIENMTKEIKEKARQVGPEFVSIAWTKAPRASEASVREKRLEWLELCRTTSFDYRPPARRYSKACRLLGLSLANTKRYLRPGVLRGSWVTCPSLIIKETLAKGKLVWLPTESAKAPHFVRGAVAFVV